MAGTKVDADGNTIQASAASNARRFNTYATKKTLASGLLDIGLLMANASQLKALIDLGPDGQEYFWSNIALISLSITLQVVAGILMLVLGSMEVKTDEEKRHVHVINDITVGLVFAVTIVNVFIASFGIKISGGGTS